MIKNLTLKQRAARMLLILSTITDNEEKLALVIDNFREVEEEAKKPRASDTGISGARK